MLYQLFQGETILNQTIFIKVVVYTFHVYMLCEHNYFVQIYFYRILLHYVSQDRPN